MEKFQECREKAKRNLHIADHMLTQTYPLVQDPKLLLAVLENVFLAMTNAMGSVLYYERLFKRVPPFHETFESKFNLFKMKSAVKYSIDPSYLILMQEVKDIILEHRRSPVEFSRKDKFIICSPNYSLKAVSINNIKEYIDKTKSFIKITDNIIEKGDTLFTKA